jgi:hypothetical protein
MYVTKLVVLAIIQHGFLLLWLWLHLIAPSKVHSSIHDTWKKIPMQNLQTWTLFT